MGTKVNPDFERATKVLLEAQSKLKNSQIAVQNSEDKSESNSDVKAMRAAELEFHNAESVWCNLEGVVDIEGENDDPFAVEKVNHLKNEVSIFYS